MSGGPHAGQPGGHRPIPPSVREALQAYGKRRGWARTTRESGVPETTLRNAIDGKNVSRENFDKLVAFVREQRWPRTCAVCPAEVGPGWNRCEEHRAGHGEVA